MAAQANAGPVMVQEAAPPPAVDMAADPAGEGMYTPTKPKANGASTQDETDDGDAWESVSLYEEILDEVDAFEYSTDGECWCPIIRPVR